MSLQIRKGFFSNKCVCGSKNLAYEDIDNWKKHGLAQDIRCEDCGQHYTEYFKAVGWKKTYNDEDDN